MKTKTTLTSFTLALAFLATSARADVITLKDGSTLTGKYSGGTATTVVFETSIGTQTIQTAQINALTFSASGATTAAAAPAAAAPATPAAPASLTIPAGTSLLVRMVDTLSSKSAKTGAPFTAKLEYDLVVGNTVAIKAGTPIKGTVKSATQARRATGKSTLALQLTQIAASGSPVPITTSDFKEAGDASIKKAARGAAAGAAIGAIADDDAGKGAAIGATAGALRKGETVTIPSGTLLEFDLTQSVTVTAAK